MAARGFGKPGENRGYDGALTGYEGLPSELANIRGGCEAERRVMSCFSSYSVADSGYSRAVTIGESTSAAEDAGASMETEFQNALESWSLPAESASTVSANGAGLCARFSVEVCIAAAGLKVCARGEGIGVNVDGADGRPPSVSPFLFRLLTLSSTERARARARAGPDTLSSGVRPRDNCLPLVSISVSASEGDKGESNAGADGYGERGYAGSDASRLLPGLAGPSRVVIFVNRIVFAATFLTSAAGWSLGERGSSKSVITGEGWYAMDERDLKTLGGAVSLKPSMEGE